MNMRTLAIAALVVSLPSLASAQRGGGGGGGSRSGRDPEMRRMGAEQNSGPRFATKDDIQDLSPAAFLRDKRKKLQLDDAAVNALKAAEGAEKDRNKEMLTAYDSVRREVQKFAGAASDLPSASNDAALRQMAFGNLTQQVRDAHARDRADALAAIPEDKRAAAEDLLKENDEDFSKKVGGGRGRRGGGN